MCHFLCFVKPGIRARENSRDGDNESWAWKEEAFLQHHNYVLAVICTRVHEIRTDHCVKLNISPHMEGAGRHHIM